MFVINYIITSINLYRLLFRLVWNNQNTNDLLTINQFLLFFLSQDISNYKIIENFKQKLSTIIFKIKRRYAQKYNNQMFLYFKYL